MGAILKRHFVVFSLLLIQVTGYFDTELCDSEACFDELKGALGDCNCNVDTVDYFNNVKIYPRIQSLLMKDYFRFFKVNLKKECPFWVDDSRCAMKYCHIKPCPTESIPAYASEDLNHELLEERRASKYTQDAKCSDDHDDQLGYLNRTISAANKEEIARWNAHDDALDNFCVSDETDVEAEYVDLLLNPERYTGYKGVSAQRIWRSIYEENCFRPKTSPYRTFPYVTTTDLNNMCLEKRVFHRAVSGLHSSINIHLCSKYLLSENSGSGVQTPGFAAPADGLWGPNLDEFQLRFDPSQTSGEGPKWLKNLYFVYLLELRALAKAGPYLQREEYFTGKETEDHDSRQAVKNLLEVVYQFPDHFNEASMFNGGVEAETLKSEFREHFRNISRIMDCVGCDKCKLWGKLQVQGLGTALKILFSGKFDDIDPAFGGRLPLRHKKSFQLQRMEIVTLFNAFGRLSESIRELENFRSILSSRKKLATERSKAKLEGNLHGNGASKNKQDGCKETVSDSAPK